MGDTCIYQSFLCHDAGGLEEEDEHHYRHDEAHHDRVQPLAAERRAAALAAELPDDRVGVRAHDKFRRGADAACVYAAETGIKNLPPSAAAPKKRENCMRLGQSPNPTGDL